MLRYSKYVFGKTMSVYNTTENLKDQFFKLVIHLKGSVWTGRL